MKNAQPETLTDRSPVGEVLLVTDAEGAVRALILPTMSRRTDAGCWSRASRGRRPKAGAPDAVRGAVEAHFAGDAIMLDLRDRQDRHGVPVGGPRRCNIPGVPDARSYGQLAAAVGRRRRCGRRTGEMIGEPDRRNKRP
jgi:methylated-DNA-[protein]-cysteine S-methyltransferase